MISVYDFHLNISEDNSMFYIREYKVRVRDRLGLGVGSGVGLGVGLGNCV